MFAKTALFCALFAASAQIALAQQPYCLLTAINKFEHPADQQTICCKDASQVQSYISDLCPSSMQSDALSAFKTACKESGYGSCSSSLSSSSSESATASATSTSAPYPVMYTTTHYDTECSCTKTKVISSTGVAGSTGFATGTARVATGTGVATGSGAGSSATGSPIAPVAPSKTGAGSPTSSTFAGAATKNVGSVAAGLLAVAGIAFAL
ncbi:hypothetical protein N7G274_004705 [Stereocaulon virgatum]|uniref:Uncharacterized protein n=1 Tax=Stereocaulon virgatum TaxID=373712 RepID=A0ABR4A8L0_9LECA